MTRRLTLLLAALCWASLAHAQIVLPGGGSGGGLASVTFTTTCPTSTQTGATINYNNGTNAVAKTASYALVAGDCGTTFDVSGTGNTQTMPTLASGYVVAFKNTNASGGASITISAGAGQTIDGAASFTLAPLQYVQISASTTGTNYDAATGAPGAAGATSPCNVGYVSGRWFTTCYGQGGGTGSNMGAGNVTCAPYGVSPGGGTFKAIGGNVDTVDTSGTTGFVSYAIYANTSGLPGALIDSIGTTALASPATAGASFGNLANITDTISSPWIWVCAASPSTTLIVRAASVSSVNLLGASTSALAVNGANTGVTGYQCTAGSANCGPVWTTGSAYTWPATLVGATWAQRTTGGAPQLALQVN